MKEFCKSLFVCLLVLLLICSCANETKKASVKNVAVFVPGFTAGSPIYDMLVKGAQKAVEETEGATITVVEAGYDQSIWPDTLREIVASGEYGIVVSSNPSLPDMCKKLTEDYKDVKFIIADAYLEGNPSIHTILYNQIEQGYIIGYIAGLVTKERNPNGKAVAGLIAAQHYPTMDKLIIPGFEKGLKAVDPNFTLEFREVGNWFDSSKASTLASSLYDSGVEVILPVAGSAGLGVVSVAKEKGKRVVWIDGSGYLMDAGSEVPVVVGCSNIAQDKLIYEKLIEAMNGNTSMYGKAEIVSAKDLYVTFDDSGDGYKNLSSKIKDAMTNMLKDFVEGKPDLSFDSF